MTPYAALNKTVMKRIVITDLDVHHGNGTQAIFEHEPRVHYLSTHQSPLFPGTGIARIALNTARAA